MPKRLQFTRKFVWKNEEKSIMRVVPNRPWKKIGRIGFFLADEKVMVPIDFSAE